MATLIRILVVEDNEDDFLALSAGLQEADGFEVERADSLAAAREKLTQRSFEACLLAARLGEPGDLVAPVVLLHEEGEEGREDAWDILSRKEISPPLLRRAVRYAIKHFQQRPEQSTTQPAEQRYRQQPGSPDLLAAVGQAVVMTGSDGEITLWNEFAEKLYGWSAHEVLGRNVLDVTPTSATRHEAEQIMARMARGESWAGEFMVSRRDGTLFPAFVTNTPVQDEEGRVTGIIGLSQDISERKQEQATLLAARDELEERVRERTREMERSNAELQAAIDELRANEARLLQGNQIATDLMRLRVRSHDELQAALRQITESATSMLAIERSSVWLFNGSATRLRCVGLFERSPGLYTRGIELPYDAHYFAAIKSQPMVVAEDVRVEPATRGYLSLYLEPNQIASLLDVPLVVAGKHIGVLCCEHVGTPRVWKAEDYTFASSIGSVCSLVIESYQRSQAEAALHQAKEEAEHATHAAESANRAKSEFLSRVSHELRTPLNAILGFGQILEMRGGDPRQLASIQQILKAGRHLLGLINEVLDIARIESGHLSLSLEPISADTIVGETLDLVRPLAQARLIHLDNQVHRECPGLFLLADQQRLKQALLNLLSNAVKYNRESGLVQVSCQILSASHEASASEHREGEANDQEPVKRARLLVRDTGAGLSPEDVAKLFVPFERLEASRSQIEGTGIGLTLCKRLVEAMHGTVGVASEPGRGSTFWIELPLAPSPLEQVTAMNAGAEEAIALPTQVLEVLGTILYIEDNGANINLIEQILSDRGLSIKLLTAMHGSVGLELAVQHLPNLILLDVHLPDTSGEIVLRRLKADPTTRNIPVVILSADATASQEERLRAAGAIAYLTKPFDLKQFYSILEEWLPQDA